MATTPRYCSTAESAKNVETILFSSAISAYFAACSVGITVDIASMEERGNLMRRVGMKVGELARRTGVSVRTLHYYDEIGLISPSVRTEAGHRLYTVADIARFQQVRSLRQVGFSLEEIQECLKRPDFSPQRIIQLHIARLKEQIKLQSELCELLEALAAHLQMVEEVSVDEFIQTIEVMSMYEKYYTKEQLEEIKARGKQIGEERIRQVEAEWPKLIEQVRAEMEKGTDPADERVQALAKRWMDLVNEFTGGNPEIEKALGKMYEQEEGLRKMTGIDQKLFEYVGKAMEAAKKRS